MNYLFLPPTMSLRLGHNLERAMAVEPPTLPVPPRIKTLEFWTFSGSWTVLLVFSVVLIVFPLGIARLFFTIFKCIHSWAISLPFSLLYWWRVLSIVCYISISGCFISLFQRWYFRQHEWFIFGEGLNTN